MSDSPTPEQDVFQELFDISSGADDIRLVLECRDLTWDATFFVEQCGEWLGVSEAVGFDSPTNAALRALERYRARDDHAGEGR